MGALALETCLLIIPARNLLLPRGRVAASLSSGSLLERPRPRLSWCGRRRDGLLPIASTVPELSVGAPRGRWGAHSLGGLSTSATAGVRVVRDGGVCGAGLRVSYNREKSVAAACASMATRGPSGSMGAGKARPS